MSTTYTIKQGDIVSQIAKDHGFQDWEVVWKDSANDSLRQKRTKPELIQPGDKLVIPDKRTKKEKVQPSAPAKFNLVPAPPLAAFSLTVVDRNGDPFDGLELEFKMPDGSTRTENTDSSGLIEIKDPKLKAGQFEVTRMVDKKGDPTIGYADFLPGKLNVGASHMITVPNKRKVADEIAAAASVARRASWGAAKPKVELEPDWDFDTVVIHHSGDGGEKSAQAIQNKHFAEKYDDIAYEYVVQLSGKIEEGRHIAFKSAGNSGHNAGKIAIIMAGDFEHQWWDSDDDPTPTAVNAIVLLVNALKVHFPLTRLVGHRDLPRAKGPTECPGGELYKLMGDMRTKTGLSS